MKKKWRKAVSVSIFTALVSGLALSGCGKEKRQTGTAEETQGTQEEASSDAAPQEEQANVLIVYFTRADNVKQDSKLDAVSSASINLEEENYIGNMEIMAQYIQESVGGDLFSIKTSELYSQDYRETTDQAKEEQDNGERPKLISHVKNMEQYDIIFLGYPNWWGGLPMPVCTFLEE